MRMTIKDVENKLGKKEVQRIKRVHRKLDLDADIRLSPFELDALKESGSTIPYLSGLERGYEGGIETTLEVMKTTLRKEIFEKIETETLRFLAGARYSAQKQLRKYKTKKASKK